VGCGWQAFVAYVNVGCYYIVGVPLGVFLGFYLDFGAKVAGISRHLLIQSCDEDQDKIVTLRNPVLTWPRDTRSNCKIAGRLEWHGGRGNHDADAHLALGHLQNRLEQGGKVTFSIYIAVVPISINLRLASDSDLVTLADKLELKSLLQVEKAKARLDKWEDKKQPLLEG
jgi:hypothetical protein